MYNKRNLLAIAAIVLFFNLFIFRMIGSLAVALFLIGLSIYLYTVTLKAKYVHKFPRTVIFLTLVTLTSLALIVYRANIYIILGLILSVLVYLGASVYLFKSGNSSPGGAFELLLIPFHLLISHLVSAVNLLIRISDRQKSPGKTSHHRKIAVYIVGFLIGLVIASILLAILSGGDPIFHQVMADLLAKISFPNIFQRLILTLIFAAIMIPVAGMTFYRITPLSDVKPLRSFREPVTVVMIMVALVMGFFLIVEWPYVFVNVARETDLSRFGVSTYSEYVRKGFAELLFAGILIYGLIWLGYIIARTKSKISGSLLGIVQMLLILESLIFLISIGRRIYLYWLFHGLTLVRFFGGVFIIYLIVMTLLLMMRHFRNRHWILTEIAVTTGFILFLGVFNAGKFIVFHHPPTVNGQIDYVYLSRMSPDAVDGWIAAFKWADQTLTTYSTREPSSYSADDRRKIAYAGSIIGTISRSYHRLINIYGTSGQIHDYSVQISSSYNAQLLNFAGKTASERLYLNQNPGQPGGALYNLASATQDDAGPDSLLAGQQARAENLANQLTSVITGSTSLQIGSITPVRFSPQSDIFSGNCRYLVDNPYTSYWCMPEFYELNPDHPSGEPNTLDRVFMWDWGSKTAFKQLNQKVGISSLLGAQEKFIRIYYEIMQLPEVDRSFTPDSATEGLFLQSF